MIPLLLRSPLTGRIYVVTRYKRDDVGLLTAITKFDVTEQFQRIEAEQKDERHE